MWSKRRSLASGARGIASKTRRRTCTDVCGAALAWVRGSRRRAARTNRCPRWGAVFGARLVLTFGEERTGRRNPDRAGTSADRSAGGARPAHLGRAYVRADRHGPQGLAKHSGIALPLRPRFASPSIGRRCRMLTEEPDPLETSLHRLRPQPLSADLRGRIAERISASARTRTRVLRESRGAGGGPTHFGDRHCKREWPRTGVRGDERRRRAGFAGR